MATENLEKDFYDLILNISDEERSSLIVKYAYQGSVMNFLQRHITDSQKREILKKFNYVDVKKVVTTTSTKHILDFVNTEPHRAPKK